MAHDIHNQFWCNYTQLISFIRRASTFYFPRPFSTLPAKRVENLEILTSLHDASLLSDFQPRFCAIPFAIQISTTSSCYPVKKKNPAARETDGLTSFHTVVCV